MRVGQMRKIEGRKLILNEDYYWVDVETGIVMGECRFSEKSNYDEFRLRAKRQGGNGDKAKARKKRNVLPYSQREELYRRVLEDLLSGVSKKEVRQRYNLKGSHLRVILYRVRNPNSGLFKKLNVLYGDRL